MLCILLCCNISQLLVEKRSSFRWFAELLAILAPFILVVFVSLLPYILLAFVKFEGLIEIETMQHPSLFTKLASFTIIQTFFITTIAGTLFSSIQDIIQNPTQGVADLASAIPEQSANFIQIIIIQNLPPLGIELLRISPIVQNILRGIVSNRLGHNLTEKERTVSCLF
jgi:calcium permeable stress-gated cation channel